VISRGGQQHTRRPPGPWRLCTRRPWPQRWPFQNPHKMRATGSRAWLPARRRLPVLVRLLGCKLVGLRSNAGRWEVTPLRPWGGRVGDWRAGLGRSLCSPLTRSFVCDWDRNRARHAVGGGFPFPTLSIAGRVHIPTMADVSRRPPIIPDGRISQVRFETLASSVGLPKVWRGLNAGPYTPPPSLVYPQLCLA